MHRTRYMFNGRYITPIEMRRLKHCTVLTQPPHVVTVVNKLILITKCVVTSELTKKLLKRLLAQTASELISKIIDAVIDLF